DRVPDHVLGQSGYTTNTTSTAEAYTIGCSSGLAYDDNHDRLFVTDYDFGRILIYDLSSGITDGMDAWRVLGSSSLTVGVDCSGPAADQICEPWNQLVYDNAHDRLFVGDWIDRRVSIWDLSGTITNGMPATHVLGQAHLDDTVNTTNQSTTAQVTGLAYDSE